MVQVLQRHNSKLIEIDSKTVSAGSWINVVDPTTEDRDWLLSNAAIVEEYLTEALDLDEQSRVEKEDDALIILLRIPHFRGIDSDQPFTTIPMLIVVTEWNFYTVCKEENIIIQEFIKERIKGFSTAKKNTFLLQIMFKTASKFLMHLRMIGKIVEKLEDELENSLQNRELMELLKYEKALIYYTTALKSNDAMMSRLRRMRLFNTFEEDDDLLEEVLIENAQAIEMTNITQQIISQMTNAYSAIINNNVNYVIKFLTIVTICISIPTLVASFYGMNIHLPGENSANVIYYVIGVSLVFIAATVLYFRKKKWF